MRWIFQFHKTKFICLDGDKNMIIVDMFAGMSIEDLRKYESEMHDETNKIVRPTQAPSSDAAAAAAVSGIDDESPSTPSNTPTEKSAPFQFPELD